MSSYLNIKEELEEMIKDGQLKIGEKLPSEYNMAKFFGVSRDTFRSAVKLLEQERKLLVKHGVGTFVIKPPSNIPSSLEKLQSIGDLIKFAGLHEGERQESISLEKCRKDWAEKLGISEGDPVYLLKRIRTADHEPVAFSINILPKAVVGNIFEETQFSGSLFRFLQMECGISILHADTEIVVPLSSDENVQKLMCTPNTTVLLLKHLNFNEKNQQVMYSLDYLRNDIFNFWIRRKKCSSQFSSSPVFIIEFFDCVE
ncbi:GntR family transcriptional regulator [Priestia abyssalis]|uniref:GntR family transcriptional regulator n=1 Tax=Priestia abyssalis TaxID=1221450 RepID=UPI000995A641|nr:GntR family transcriptional regulator [Priestia abyssalis]